MTLQKSAFEMAAASEELIRSLDREKVCSSSITRHSVTMAKKSLALAVAKFRMMPPDQPEPLAKTIRRKPVNANFNWLSQ